MHGSMSVHEIKMLLDKRKSENKNSGIHAVPETYIIHICVLYYYVTEF